LVEFEFASCIKYATLVPHLSASLALIAGDLLALSQSLSVNFLTPSYLISKMVDLTFIQVKVIYLESNMCLYGDTFEYC
jgi:hypothetical protein